MQHEVAQRSQRWGSWLFMRRLSFVRLTALLCRPGQEQLFQKFLPRPESFHWFACARACFSVFKGLYVSLKNCYFLSYTIPFGLQLGGVNWRVWYSGAVCDINDSCCWDHCGCLSHKLVERVASSLQVCFLSFALHWYSSTGWSLKTVNCNLFLTNPKNSKSAKTRWFSESLYREVWYFDVSKLSGVWKFAFRNFSNIEPLLHHTGPDHSYTTLYAFKP